jgi:AcrR family transcriptional regulator
MTMVTRIRSNRAIPRAVLQARIGRAALSLFKEAGFDSVSVDQIVAKAGVSKGAFFNFFPTKADALLVYFRELDGRLDKLRERLDPTRPLAALQKFFEQAERILRAEGPLLETLSRAIWSHPMLMKADHISAKEDRTAFANFFERARRAGTIKTSDPTLVADAVGDLWTGSILMWLSAGRSYSFSHALNAKVHLLFKGLQARSKS